MLAPPSATVHFKDEQLDVTVEVRRATVLDGIRRAALTADVSKALGDDDSPLSQFLKKETGLEITASIAAYTLLRFTYPSCLACVANVTNATDSEFKVETSLTPIDFLSLPELFIEAWEDQVYILNPHWDYRKLFTKAKVEAGENLTPEEKLGEGKEPVGNEISTTD